MKIKKVPSIRGAFVRKFGKKLAGQVERCAEDHSGRIIHTPIFPETYDAVGKFTGSDPFRWALVVVIGFECLSKSDYREYHEIETPWAQIKAWIIDRAEIEKHDGDWDRHGIECGYFRDFLPENFEIPA